MLYNSFLNEDGVLETNRWVPENLTHYRLYNISAIVPIKEGEKDELRIIFETIRADYYSRRTFTIELIHTKELLIFDGKTPHKSINEWLLNYSLLYENSDNKVRAAMSYSIDGPANLSKTLKESFGIVDCEIYVKDYGELIDIK